MIAATSVSRTMKRASVSSAVVMGRSFRGVLSVETKHYHIGMARHFLGAGEAAPQPEQEAA